MGILAPASWKQPSPTKKLRFNTWLLKGPFCHYCGKIVWPNSNYHFEHSLPFSRGGYTNIGNGVVSCKNCNLQKGAKTKKEYLAYRGMLELNSGYLFSFFDIYLVVFGIFIGIFIYLIIG